VLAGGPQVVTIHDVHVLNTPSLIRKIARGIFEYLSAKRADAVIAPSAAARQDIAKAFGVPAERICVVHEAPKTIGRAMAEDEGAVLARHGIQRPYVVAFSNPSSHKNIARLARCYKRVAGYFEHSLVLVGSLPQDPGERAEITSGPLAGRVRPLGYVPDADVPAILKNADLFVFPSWYEGFGLPVLEAQMYGVPAICSTAASLPEVAGEGALYFDPYSDEELVQRLGECLASEELRATLRLRGYENLKRFSWRAAATQTMEVYRCVVERRSPIFGLR
jgi:glycosyltransferase involved in cell wall biosynthesis